MGKSGIDEYAWIVAVSTGILTGSYQWTSGGHGDSRHRLGTANAVDAGQERKRASFELRSVLSTFI